MTSYSESTEGTPGKTILSQVAWEPSIVWTPNAAESSSRSCSSAFSVRRKHLDLFRHRQSAARTIGTALIPIPFFGVSSLRLFLVCGVLRQGRGWAAIAALASAGWLAGCDDPSPIGRVRVDTLSGGRVVISSPDRPSDDEGAAPTLAEELRIGSAEGFCDAFGNVFSLAVDDAGRTYVADLSANAIAVFDAHGDCLHTFGRAGEGPGEFSMLAGIARQAPGLVWAMDAIQYRLTVFDAAGSVQGTHSLPPSGSASLPWRLWVDTNHALHLWDPGPRNIVKYRPSSGLVPVDTFPVPWLEPDMYEREIEWAGGSMMTRSPIPYTPEIAWTVDSDGEVWLANQSEFDLHETTYDGDTLRTVRLLRSAPNLAGGERDSLAAAVGIAAARLPERKTVLKAISVASDGWIWVDRGERPITVWDVFDERGHYMGPVSPPVPVAAEPFPVFHGEAIVAVTEDELGVQYVVWLRVIR